MKLFYHYAVEEASDNYRKFGEEIHTLELKSLIFQMRTESLGHE
jgi:hypothetical protein